MFNPDNISFLQIGEQWPPQKEVLRLQRYSKNRDLFKGEHFSVYKDWVRLLREDKRAVLELIVNFPGAVSKLFADLLFGEMPNYVADSPEANEWVKDFTEANKIDRLNYKAALAQSYRGEALYKLRLIEGRDRAVLEVIPANIWFPVVNPDNVNEIQAHVLAWVKEVSYRDLLQRDKVRRYLRTEIHYSGNIANRLYLLENDKITERIDLSALYDNPPPDDELTGVDAPLVFHVPNLEMDDTVYGVDDYMEADTLFQELNIRMAQIARVLDKHTDPNMYGPGLNEEDPDTGDPTFIAGGKYFQLTSQDPVPGYLVWDAQLEANFKFLDKIMQGLYIVTDTNAAAFSMVESGSFPSGAALKRLLMRPLARTNRKRLFFDPVLKEIFSVAAELERANGRKAPKDLSIRIEWKDGLPDDPLEQANIENIRTGGRATSSVRSAIRRLDGGSEEAIDNELIEIEADEYKLEQIGLQQTRSIFGTENLLEEEEE